MRAEEAGETNNRVRIVPCSLPLLKGNDARLVPAPGPEGGLRAAHAASYRYPCRSDATGEGSFVQSLIS